MSTPPLAPPQTKNTFGEGKREPRVTGLHPRVMMDGQHTITKFCEQCKTQMPHKVGAGCCILCELDADVIASGQNHDQQ